MFFGSNGLGPHRYTWPSLAMFLVGLRWDANPKEGRGWIYTPNCANCNRYKEVTWLRVPGQLLKRVFSISTPGSKYKQPQFKKKNEKSMLHAKNNFRMVSLSSPLTKNPITMGLIGDFQHVHSFLVKNSLHSYWLFFLSGSETWTQALMYANYSSTSELQPSP